jgi:hypothetical protein
MKILSTLALLVISICSYAQKIWLTPFAGYTFRETITLSSGYSARIDDGAHYGASLEYMPRSNFGIELMYQRQQTTATPDTYFSMNPIDVTIQYITVGALHHHAFAEKLDGYGGLNLGLAFGENKYNDENFTKMGIGIKAGLAIKPTPKIAIRLQGQVLSVVQGFGAGFYAGTGGSGAGVSTYSSIFQFGLTGGISIGLGQ